MRRKRIQFQSKKKINLSWTKRFIKPLVILLLVLTPFLLVPQIIQIKNVTCESQYGPCSEILSEYLSKAAGKNYSVSKGYINSLFKKQILTKNYWVKFKLPDTLEVYAQERKPVIAFASSSEESKFVMVDEEGYILAIQEDNQLPVIIVKENKKFTVGDRIEEDLSEASHVMQQAYRLFDSKLAIYNDRSLEIDLPIGTKVIFPLGEDLEVLFGSLSLILSRLNTSALNSTIEVVDKRIPKLVDLRYKNPVIQFK